VKKYPFSPAILDALPEELAELFRGLEDTLLDEICSRLALKDQLNEVTVQAIRALRSHGIDTKEIEKAIRKTSGISEKKLKELFNDVIARNQKYYTELIDLAHITQPETLVSVEDTWAIYEQTKQTLRNITRSMGFLVNAGRTMLPPAKAYQWALDNAVMQIQSSAISYNQAIKSAVQQLAGGLKVVNYESGHVDNIDVAVRRAVMTGVNQICDQYTNQSAEYLETRYFEVSAHSGARDKPGASPWSSHKEWQGKVYYQSESGEPDPLGLYDDLVETTGYGYVDGLTGANCRHHKYPFLPGVSERTYTDEQLAHIDDGLGCEFDGKKYTAYEATQMQRRIERQIRAQKRLKDGYEKSGLSEDAQAANIKLRRLNAKYKDFSEAAGLPEQRERTKVLYNDTKAVANTPESAIIKEIAVKGGEGVQTIGRIDRDKYSVVSSSIRTDEVIISDERIKHIMDHHPNDYQRYAHYIGEMLENPQYILDDPVQNTAVILHEFIESNEHFRLILKLAVIGDEEYKKNSIITFLKISEKKFKKYLRNKKILYKSE
jgi:hypothetical protein